MISAELTRFAGLPLLLLVLDLFHFFLSDIALLLNLGITLPDSLFRLKALDILLLRVLLIEHRQPLYHRMNLAFLGIHKLLFKGPFSWKIEC